MPRAFIVPEAQVVAQAEQPLTGSGPARRGLHRGDTGRCRRTVAGQPPAWPMHSISRYTTQDVFVDVNLSDRGWLVLTDAYFPGWKAYIRPFGADENEESELPIYRADSAFRTVYLPEDGQWTVRFVYSPMSFKVGLYVSFLAFMTLLFLLLYWGWGRYYRPETTEGDVRTVAKNSLVPMTLSLGNKAIDFAFAMLYVRILGPEGTGKYLFCRGHLRLLRDHQPLRPGHAAHPRRGCGQESVQPLSDQRAGSAHLPLAGRHADAWRWSPGSIAISAAWGYFEGVESIGMARRFRPLRSWPWPCSLPTGPTPIRASSSPLKRWSIRPA